ncbi:MAG: AAA family ATPase, partial [Planctomycetes bacterium]|nr:AAA family ATPase [Planctomycetota bacterium]
MRLRSLQIQNFRSFNDETITFDDYTCFVGSNGAGKSAILTALNVFFRNNASTATDVQKLTSEDFHHKNTTKPIRITLTFDDLSPEAQEDFKHYYRQGQLTIFSEAVWNPENEAAEVKQYGVRLVMKQFARFFDAEGKGTKVPALKEIYKEIAKGFQNLPPASTKPAMVEALRSYEEAHSEECELLEDPHEFYGWTKGKDRLEKYLQWVYVPAVKDASTEQEEGSKTALGQLLERTVRTKLSFKEPIAALRRTLEESYKKIIDQEKDTLAGLAASIRTRLRSWANPGADLSLDWYYYESGLVRAFDPCGCADGFEAFGCQGVPCTAAAFEQVVVVDVD